MPSASFLPPKEKKQKTNKNKQSFEIYFSVIQQMMIKMKKACFAVC